jgi:hypothetical protein
MIRELGVFQLNERGGAEYDQCVHYLLNADTDNTLSIIEVFFRLLRHCYGNLNDYHRSSMGIVDSTADAIDELNLRFHEHSIGYQFVEQSIIRVDSQYIHAEVVLPALTLLSQPGFEGPLDEFMGAHKHYREHHNEEAIADALKAFESTMKAICDVRNWTYNKNSDAATALIRIVFEHELIPAYLQTQFGALRTLLESGAPTVRNRNAGHGQGSAIRNVPPHIAAYALHMTAANIVLLVEAHNAL